MADRSVVVRLRAEVDGYVAGLNKAKSATAQFGKEVTLQGKSSKADIEAVGRGALVMGGSMLAGFGLAANAVMGFDKQLSELGAVSSATAAEMAAFREQALQAGADTAFSAAEAAQAQTELAKAGVSTADILGGALTGALDLAAAGGLQLGQAAEIAASAMTTFGLKGGDVSRIADALAAGANKSAADVDDMAQALAQSGLVADQFGLSLEETVGTLAMFAQRGLRGSDAGTSFKTMLQRLVPQSAEAKRKMEELGIEMFDARGNFIGIDGAAQELQESLGGLTQEARASALGILFGSDAVRAATIFYEGGAREVDKWTTAVSDAGFAGDVAAKRMDNLAGDLEELKGSIGTALIEGGTHATGVLRFMAQGATDAVNAVGSLPGPVQAGGMALAGIGGAGLVAAGGLLTMIPKITEARAALVGLGPAGASANRALGTLGKLAGGAAGIAAFSASMIVLHDQLEQLFVEDAPDLDRMGLALVDFGMDAKISGELAAAFGSNLSGLADDLKLLDDRRSGFHIDLAEDFDEAVGRIDAVDKALAQLVDSGHADQADAIFQGLVDSFAGTGVTVEQLEAELGDYDAALARAETQSKLTGGATDELAGSLTLNEQAAQDAQEAFEDLMDAYQAAVSPLFGMLAALDGNRAAQAELNEVLADGESTAAEIDAAYRAVAESALDVEVAAAELNNEIANGNVTLDQANTMLGEWVAAGLLTAEQAAQVATQFGRAADEGARIAPEYTTKVTADTVAAEEALRRIVQWQDKVGRSIVSRIELQLDNPFARVPGFQLGAAEGGFVGSPGRPVPLVITKEPEPIS